MIFAIQFILSDMPNIVQGFSKNWTLFNAKRIFFEIFYNITRQFSPLTFNMITVILDLNLIVRLKLLIYC